MNNISEYKLIDDYYNRIKIQFLDYIPEGPNNVLDIGCGTGRLGGKLKKENKARNIVGVEIFPPAARQAMDTYDHVYIGDIESIKLDYFEYFDVIICGDILEHLVDPWGLINCIYKWLKGDGIVICTLPNIRYLSILYEVIISGVWLYRDAGILDKSHLRFFTNKTAKKMIEDGKFTIIYTEIMVEGWKKNAMNIISIGIFREFLGKQMMYVFKKN